MVNELEEDRAESLKALLEDSPQSQANSLPESCNRWISEQTVNSSAFVTCFTQDFQPKLLEHAKTLANETAQTLASLKHTASDMDEPANLVLKHLNFLHSHFTTDGPSADPWIHELAIRHHSARFLERKEKYLETLLAAFVQVRSLSSECNFKLQNFSNDFLNLLNRFNLNNNNNNPASPNIQTTHQNTSWQSILEAHNLNYDWTLLAPPLDGFLSTLFTHLKSQISSSKIPHLNHQFSQCPDSALPSIFSQESLRFGFLQKSVSSLLIARSWQCNFCILQPETHFLHLYKESSLTQKNSSPANGHLLVPNPNSCSYAKSTLNDINSLALQFLLQNPHQPACIAPEILSPSMSIHIGQASKIIATNPDNFVFQIKGPEKIVLKAFCEEEFVDWVIALNKVSSPSKETNNSKTKESKSSTPSNSPKTESTTETTTKIESSDPPQSTDSFAIPAPIVENPWE